MDAVGVGGMVGSYELQEEGCLIHTLRVYADHPCRGRRMNQSSLSQRGIPVAEINLLGVRFEL